MSVPLKPKAIGIGAILAVFLYISGLLVILTPLPLVYVSATAGRRNAVYAGGLAFIVIMALYFIILGLAQTSAGGDALTVPLPGLGLISHFSITAVEIFGGGYFLFFLTMALILGEAVREHWGLVKGGARALIASVFLALFIVAILQIFGVAQVFSSLKNYLEFMVAEVVRLQEAAGVTSAQTTLLAERGPEIALFLFRVIPALVFVFALMAIVFNLLLSRRFIRMPHVFSGHQWDVAAFRFPDVAVWVVIGAAVCFLAGQYLLDGTWIKYFGINILIALGAVYFFQGMAVVAFFVRRIRFPLFRLLIYLGIILFFQTVGFLIVGLGLADIWVNFRRRARKVHAHTE